jgi:hypothetical protein
MKPATDHLGDFSHVLALLDPVERRRAEALAEYAVELFDLASQADGSVDPVARQGTARSIERWFGDLEHHWPPSAEDGVLPAALLRLAPCHRERPYDRDALARLVATALERALKPRPETPREAQAAAERFGGALAEALLDPPVSEALARFAGALVRLSSLQNLGAHLAAGRCPLPVSELPDAGPRPDLRATVRAVRQECRSLRPRLLGVAPALVELPAAYQKAGAFLLLAALRLLSELEEADTDFLVRPPHLGRWTIQKLKWRAKRRGLGAVG